MQVKHIGAKQDDRRDTLRIIYILLVLSMIGTDALARSGSIPVLIIDYREIKNSHCEYGMPCKYLNNTILTEPKAKRELGLVIALGILLVSLAGVFLVSLSSKWLYERLGRDRI